jgi:DNA gyrase subunit A
MGRAAAGVRGMRIGADDQVVEADVARIDDKYVFSVSENGIGKLSEVSEYREQGRGGSGVKVGAITAKTGDIIGVSLVTDEMYKE